MTQPKVAGWRCMVCAATVDIAEQLAWRCPNSTSDDRHHELELISAPTGLTFIDHDNPFVAFRPHLAWDAFAAALGMTEAAREALLISLDDRIAAVAGTGFRITPFGRNPALSIALNFTSGGGVWVKNETANVGGSHKARHLFTILAHLMVVESTHREPWETRPPLAIASCGNAAIAASTLAAAVEWPIRVFVPEWADDAVVRVLTDLGAEIVTCPRLASDPPGDPCVYRFREAVQAGAVPFSVQGPENAWCLDGGRTIGWEMAMQLGDTILDRVVVQVGSGALAACVSSGLTMGGQDLALHAMQTVACAPLERAWGLLGDPATAGSRWAETMWPWEDVGQTVADGIIDDETYDWLPVVNGMVASGGFPVVSEESEVDHAWHMLRGTNTSATGSAGVAGLITLRKAMKVADTERVAVILSGVQR